MPGFSQPGCRRPSWRSRVPATLAVAMAVAVVACSDSSPAPSAAPEAATVSDSEGAALARTLARGEALYALNCQSCHGDREGAGNDGVAPLHNEQGHTFHHPDAQLKDFILRGKPPGLMPAFGSTLTEQQVETILSLIKTWWIPADLEVQEDISRRYQEALDKQNAD